MTRRNTQAALCQATHRHEPDRPRHAADGLNLCPGCWAALYRHLGVLPHLHQDVLDSLPTSGQSDGPAVSGSRETPIPYNPRAGDWLSQARHDLGWLVNLVTVQRGLTGPSLAPAERCAWLLTHADWLAARDDAGPYKDTLGELVGRGYSVIDPARQPLTIGPCNQQDGDGPCDGILKATVRRDGDPAPSVIWCDVCDLNLDTTQWHKFGRLYQRGRMAG